MRTRIITAAVLAASVFTPRVHAQTAPVQGDVQIGMPETLPPTQVAPPPTYPTAPPPQQPVYYMMVDPRPHPYRGGPLPPGTHVESRPMIGLAIAGAAVFGGMYLIDAVAEPLVSVPSPGWLFLPVVGPFVVGAQSTDASLVAAMVFSGVAQLAGVGMFVAGLVAHQQWVVPGPRAARHTTPARWAVLPGAAGAIAGLSFRLVGF